jgi:hypothetical protein
MISFVQDADHISDRLTSLKRELSDIRIENVSS